MLVLTGKETAQEVIAISYGLEEGLQKFYAACADLAVEPEVGQLLSKLAEIEVRHREKLFNAYLEIESDPIDRKTFAADINTEMTEGGFNVDELMRRHRSTFNSSLAVLNFAMMLEAQAMDLYMRYAEKCEDSTVKEVLYNMAEEEKAHLKSLGDLLGKQVNIK
jgi:rubrerythrin